MTIITSLLALVFFIVASLNAQQPATASKPLSPQESLAKIHVPAGFNVELVAAEPQVLDPVAFDWDDKGRMWVVEMADYPLGMDGKGKPGGRIRMLSDPDASGRYTKGTLFADGLNFPTGILTWRDGVLVTAAPDILFLRDTDGDGKADVREVLYTGFFEGNQQLRVNGLRWGMDGWVYCAAGAHNANHGSQTKITCKRTGAVVQLGSRDFRIRPDTGALDPQSGPSQFGRCRDDWGNWFGVQNSWPLWHYVLQDHYIRRNPHVAPPDPIVQLVGPRNPKVWPASTLEKRFHSFDQSGHFTSACGIEIYRDRLLFNDADKTHAFTCEPFHNLVQHHILEDDGVTFKASRDPAEKERDFFASEDRWCRPVMARTGPDGALYIADMYRYMIEHPQWLPQGGKDELLPHYREGDDKGRIWRVTHSRSSRGDEAHLSAEGATSQIQSLVTSAATDPVRALSSANGWLRDKAQMTLIWKDEKDRKDTNGAVAALATTGKTPQTRAQAAWTLDCLGQMTSALAAKLLADESPRVREQALRIAEKHESREVIAAAAKLVDHADAKVRLQLACSLGEWRSHAATTALARLIEAEKDDLYLSGAALSSAATHGLGLVGDPGTQPEISQELVATMCGAGGDQAILRLFGLGNVADGPWYEIEMLRNVLRTMKHQGSATDHLTVSENGSSAESTLRAAMIKNWLATASVMSKSEEILTQPAKARNVIEALLLHPKHRAEGLAALKTNVLSLDVFIELATEHAGEDAAALLVRWPDATPATRSKLLSAMLASNQGTIAVLERVRTGEITLSSFDASTQSRLLKHPSKVVAKLADVVFSRVAISKRADVIAKFKPALTLKGDAKNGEVVFSQLCIACHALNGKGIDLGPNLVSVRAHPADKLLNSILDPSANIEPGFVAYFCTLKSGQQFYGCIASETANSITLKQAGGISTNLLRSEIASLKSANVSLMPDGLEASLTPQSLADVIAFLKGAGGASSR